MGGGDEMTKYPELNPWQQAVVDTHFSALTPEQEAQIRPAFEKAIRETPGEIEWPTLSNPLSPFAFPMALTLVCEERRRQGVVSA